MIDLLENVKKLPQLPEILVEKMMLYIDSPVASIMRPLIKECNNYLRMKGHDDELDGEGNFYAFLQMTGRLKDYEYEQSKLCHEEMIRETRDYSFSQSEIRSFDDYDNFIYLC